MSNLTQSGLDMGTTNSERISRGNGIQRCSAGAASAPSRPPAPTMVSVSPITPGSTPCPCRVTMIVNIEP